MVWTHAIHVGLISQQAFKLATGSRLYKIGRKRQVSLDSWELTIFAGVLIVFFLWGPNKLPDLARANGRAKREFDRASEELTNPPETSPIDKGSGPAWASAPTSPETSSDDVLIATANRLGIITEGKTRDEISNEILQKTDVDRVPPALHAPHDLHATQEKSRT
jgi:sec-independent protein translocase protein TatA